MKIKIDLPDWCDERNIYIMAGIELIAYKNAGKGGWHVKTVRCNSCGKCCQGMSEDAQYRVNENGDCNYLIPNGEKMICSLGSTRPFPCCEGDPVKNNGIKQSVCCIEYKEV